MTAHALLVNTISTDPIDMLETDPWIRLTVITHPEYASCYRPRTPVILIEDVTDLRQVRDAAVALLRAGPIDHVVAPSERSVQPGGYLRSFLGLPGTGYETANLCSNKLAMKRRLAAGGLPVAPFAGLGALADLPARATELGWPVVVKPVIGNASRDTHVVAGAAEFAELLASPRSAGLRRSPYPLIVERFVDVEAEFHCDGVVSGGEVRFASVSRYVVPLVRQYGRLGGTYTLPTGSPDIRPITDLHRAVVAALGVRDGITHLEVLRSGGDYLVGEIAARPGGCGVTDVVRQRYGVDLWRAFVDISLGRQPGCDPVDAGGVAAVCHLPTRPGRVEHVTTAAELAALPGVTGVRDLVRPGEVITGEVNSSAFAGQVFLRVADEPGLAAALDRLERAFTLTVSPPAEPTYRTPAVA
jgi:hypothetical protein